MLARRRHPVKFSPSNRKKRDSDARLLALSLMMGIVNAITQPARLALIPNLVERPNLAAAVAINSTIFNAARFLGPAVAGGVIAYGSIALAFAVNAASYIAFLIALQH